MGKNLLISFWGIGSLCILVSFQGCGEPRLSAAPSIIQEKKTALKISEYCPQDGYIFSEIFAYNSSSILEYNRHVSDFDRDGLSDDVEKQQNNISTFNIGYLTADTNADGYSDLIVHLLGFDTDNQIRLDTCVDPNQDTDRDHLTDCAEAVLGLDPLMGDTDGDDVPDGLEVRFGTNAADPMDSLTDTDQDQKTVLEEIKTNTPHKITNDPSVDRQAYVYDVKAFVNDSMEQCYRVYISNIPVADVSNGNLVHVLVTEKTTIQNQGDVTRVKNLSVLIPRSIEGNRRVVVDDIDNQVIDGISTPLVVEVDDEKTLDSI